jgi:hypothetical protein
MDISGARTLDLRVDSAAFFLCAMWHDKISLNFDNFLFRQKKRRWRAEEGRGTRLELGIAGRKKNAFYALFTIF